MDRKAKRPEGIRALGMLLGRAAIIPITIIVHYPPLSLARALKSAIIYGGSEEHIPRDHARWLISALGLR